MQTGPARPNAIGRRRRSGPDAAPPAKSPLSVVSGHSYLRRNRVRRAGYSTLRGPRGLRWRNPSAFVRRRFAGTMRRLPW